MKYTVTEQKALKKLGITDFKHMTKDKVVKFTSMLPKMDPEVAKAAMEQFPEFCSYGKEVVKSFMSVIDKTLESNKGSVDQFYNTCQEIIHSLQKELENNNLSPDERSRVEDKMILVAQMLSEKDSENKKWYLWIVGIVGALSLGALGTGAAILGGNTSIGRSRKEDDEDVA